MIIIYYNNILTSFTITYIVVYSLQEYFIKVVDEHLTLNNKLIKISSNFFIIFSIIDLVWSEIENLLIVRVLPTRSIMNKGDVTSVNCILVFVVVIGILLLVNNSLQGAIQI